MEAFGLKVLTKSLVSLFTYFWPRSSESSLFQTLKFRVHYPKIYLPSLAGSLSWLPRRNLFKFNKMQTFSFAIRGVPNSEHLRSSDFIICSYLIWYRTPRASSSQKLNEEVTFLQTLDVSFFKELRNSSLSASFGWFNSVRNPHCGCKLSLCSSQVLNLKKS